MNGENIEILKKIHTKPKIIYLLPLIGWIKYIVDTVKTQRKTVFNEEGHPSKVSIDAFTKKYLIILNIWLPIFTLICIVFFQFRNFYLKKTSIESNKNSRRRKSWK